MKPASKAFVPACPVSVVTTANPRSSAGVAPAACAPSGNSTLPFNPPPPCCRNRPFQSSGRLMANLMPYGLPSAPVRRSMTPSTRQYAGNFSGDAGPGPPGPAGGGEEPAAVQSAFVISRLTPGTVKFFIAAQAADRDGVCAVASSSSSASIDTSFIRSAGLQACLSRAGLQPALHQSGYRRFLLKNAS